MAEINHFLEAERLLEKSKNGETAEYLSDGDDAALRLTWATQAQAHALLALAVVQAK